MDDTQVLDCTQAFAFPDEDEEEKQLVAWLEIESQRYDIYSGENKIGRDPLACSVILESKGLSKEHARICVERGVHTLEDLGSLNKTRLGKLALEPGIRFALNGGEVIRFGNVRALYIKNPSLINGNDSDTESESLLPLDDSIASPQRNENENNESCNTNDDSIILPTPLESSKEAQLSTSKICISETPQHDRNETHNAMGDSFFEDSRLSLEFDENYNSDVSTDIEENGLEAKSTVEPTEKKSAVKEVCYKQTLTTEEASLNKNSDDENCLSGDEDIFNQATQIFCADKRYKSDNSLKNDISEHDNTQDVANLFCFMSPTAASPSSSHRQCDDISTQQVVEAFVGSPPGKAVFKMPNIISVKCRKPVALSLPDDEEIPDDLFIKDEKPANCSGLDDSLLYGATQVYCEETFGKGVSPVKEKLAAVGTQIDNMFCAPTQVFKKEPILDLHKEFCEAPTEDFVKECFGAKTEIFGKENYGARTQVFMNEINNQTTQPFSKEGHSAQTLSKDNFEGPTQAFVKDSFDGPTQAFVKDSFDGPTKAFVKDSFDGPTQAFVKDSFDGPTKAFVKDSFDGPTQAFVKDSFDGPTKAFVKDSFDGPTQAFVKDSFDGATQALVKDSFDGATQALVKDSFDGPTQALVKDSFDGPTQAFVKDSFDGPTQALVKDSFDGPTQAFVKDSFDGPTQALVKDSFDGPTQAFVKDSFDGQSKAFVKDSFDGPTQAFVKDSFDGQSKAFVKDSFDGPTQAFVKDSFDGPTQAFVEDSFDGPTQAFVEDSFDGPTQAFVKDSFDGPTQVFIKDSFDASTQIFKKEIVNSATQVYEEEKMTPILQSNDDLYVPTQVYNNDLSIRDRHNCTLNCETKVLSSEGDETDDDTNLSQTPDLPDETDMRTIHGNSATNIQKENVDNSMRKIQFFTDRTDTDDNRCFEDSDSCSSETLLAKYDEESGDLQSSISKSPVILSDIINAIDKISSSISDDINNSSNHEISNEVGGDNCKSAVPVEVLESVDMPKSSDELNAGSVLTDRVKSSKKYNLYDYNSDESTDVEIDTSINPVKTVTKSFNEAITTPNENHSLEASNLYLSSDSDGPNNPAMDKIAVVRPINVLESPTESVATQRPQQKNIEDINDISKTTETNKSVPVEDIMELESDAKLIAETSTSLSHMKDSRKRLSRRSSIFRTPERTWRDVAWEELMPVDIALPSSESQSQEKELFFDQEDNLFSLPSKGITLITDTYNNESGDVLADNLNLKEEPSPSSVHQAEIVQEFCAPNLKEAAKKGRGRPSKISLEKESFDQPKQLVQELSVPTLKEPAKKGRGRPSKISLEKASFDKPKLVAETAKESDLDEQIIVPQQLLPQRGSRGGRGSVKPVSPSVVGLEDRKVEVEQVIPRTRLSLNISSNSPVIGTSGGRVRRIPKRYSPSREVSNRRLSRKVPITEPVQVTPAAKKRSIVLSMPEAHDEPDSDKAKFPSEINSSTQIPNQITTLKKQKADIRVTPSKHTTTETESSDNLPSILTSAKHILPEPTPATPSKCASTRFSAAGSTAVKNEVALPKIAPPELIPVAPAPSNLAPVKVTPFEPVPPKQAESKIEGKSLASRTRQLTENLAKIDSVPRRSCRKPSVSTVNEEPVEKKIRRTRSSQVDKIETDNLEWSSDADVNDGAGTSNNRTVAKKLKTEIKESIEVKKEHKKDTLLIENSEKKLTREKKLPSGSRQNSQDVTGVTRNKSSRRAGRDAVSESEMKVEEKRENNTNGNIASTSSLRLRKQELQQTVKEEIPMKRSLSSSSQESARSIETKRSCRKGHDSSNCPGTPPILSRTGSIKGSPSGNTEVAWLSERQQKASVKPRVLFTGYKDAADEKIVVDLGASVVDSALECTVLVTTAIKRTCKLLAVMGRGLPIVTPVWIAASKQARNFVDPWMYLIRDTETEKKFDFKLSQTLVTATKERLFTGLSIHITPSVKPPPKEMLEIVECAGGEYCATLPQCSSGQLIVVSCAEDKKLWPTFKRREIPIMGSEFIMTGLLRHQLIFDEYRLG